MFPVKFKDDYLVLKCPLTEELTRLVLGYLSEEFISQKAFFNQKKKIIRKVVGFVFYLHEYENRSSSLPQELASFTVLKLWMKTQSPGFKNQKWSKNQHCLS